MRTAEETILSLRNCLESLPSLELEAVKLLRSQHPSASELFPSLQGMDRENLATAISELVQYTETSQKLARNLRAMPAIALESLIILDFGL